jgi:putative membrane-bound dehydrogenase-like protein
MISAKILARVLLVVAAACGCLCDTPASLLAAEANSQVGVAKVDITPDYPVRLNGYGGRRTEDEGVVHPLWAKALAIGSDADGPTVLITVDNLGVPDYLVSDVAGRLQKKVGLPRERLAVCSSHAHTAPCLTNVAPTIFGVPIPPDHQAHIDRYTRELADKLEQVALAALKDRRPSHLAWGQGKVDFAQNRRTPGGPVDHDMPLLRVTDAEGKVRAILVNYACHCTALEDNKISGDWAGYAQLQIERGHPGAIALVAIGCGADANPQPRTGHQFAMQHGTAIAREVERLLAGELKPLTSKVTARLKRIKLPFDTLPTREEWQRRAALGGAVGYHAQVQLARLDAGKPLQTELDYPIQTWMFGDDLAMVFLSGEVVVDYSLRLKKEFDASRLWVNAYSNDVPCYIPSKRILKEGGYEGGDAMIYYDRPTRFTPAVEDLIVDTVELLLPRSYWSADKRAESPLPMSPAESLAAIKLKPRFRAELVAAEPLVVDPVAIDFGPDGRLWVVEMNDYPTGLDRNWQPGGRLKYLEDLDGDGRYDKATLVAEDLPFPTGVMAWRDGALVCAAPDILYIADKDHDGRPETREVLFTGFPTENYQARVNGLSYGLDNWIHGANGLLGGEISRPGHKEKVNLGARDFRFWPATLEFEATSGLTQQGRIHDDWGNWFGSTNGALLNHYPVPDHYLRRNPHVIAPQTQVYVPRGNEPNKLYPASHTLIRFNDPELFNQVTSACGASIYRDTLLGPDVAGDSFTCEPVHNLVSRRKLTAEGVTFAGHRVEDEQNSEFLASTDNWFRPVQTLTGPDGALWVVDMYRFVIEHPRWITPDRLRKLDVRAGSDRGRIYRVFREDRPPRRIVRLDGADTAKLVAALDSPNGPQRDLAQRLLVERNDAAAAPLLAALAKASARPQTRVQALCTLGGLGAPGAEALRSGLIVSSLRDKHPGVRRHAVRLCDTLLAASPSLGEALLPLVEDADAMVRYQLAFTLGYWRDPRAGTALARLALADQSDPYHLAAVASSVSHDTMSAFAATLVPDLPKQPHSDKLVSVLIGLAATLDDPATVRQILTRLASARTLDAAESLGRMQALGSALDALDQQGGALSKIFAPTQGPAPSDDSALMAAFERARASAADPKAAEPLRLAAINLLGRVPARQKDDAAALGLLLAPQTPQSLQTSAVAALARMDGTQPLEVLLAGWQSYSPALRTQVLHLALSRPSWTTALLDRVEHKLVSATEFDAASRQALLNHGDPKIRSRAEAAFAGSVDSNRQRVIEEHQAVLTLLPDAVHGADVFKQKCSVCHRLRNVGDVLGPDLAALSDKSPGALLTAILDPNRAVEAKYVSYVAATSRGLTHTGILVEETSNSITLASQQGARQVIPRAELDQLQSTGKSFMPEGLEKDLSGQDLADVIAFVGGTAAPPKSVPGNRPELVAPTADGDLRLLARNCEIHGGPITFEEPFGNIGMWQAPSDHVVWTIETPRAASYRVELEYACASDVAGNAFVLEARPPVSASARLGAKVAGTGTWADYHKVSVGELPLAAGRQRIVLRPDGAINGALMDLREVHLTLVDPKQLGETDPAKPSPAALAKQILDSKQPAPARAKLIASHPNLAASILREMTLDEETTPWSHDEEHRRIPWLWQVSIAAGRGNDADQIRAILTLALPAAEKPLRQWQAVVLGGGIVNGIAQAGAWPRERITAIIKDDRGLVARWDRVLDLAARMADDESVTAGTRYDALRILGTDTWERCGQRLLQYLKSGANGELQMGAVSALSDIRHPKVGDVLVEQLSDLSAGNQQLALDALLRDERRASLLLDQVAAHKIKAEQLGKDRIRQLVENSDESVRQKARAILK